MMAFAGPTEERYRRPDPFVRGGQGSARSATMERAGVDNGRRIVGEELPTSPGQVTSPPPALFLWRIRRRSLILLLVDRFHRKNATGRLELLIVGVANDFLHVDGRAIGEVEGIIAHGVSGKPEL